MSARPSTDDRSIFLAGGEMGDRTRSFDWSQTPLGPIATWPQSLKIAVRIMLGSRYAMWLGWGSDFTFFYNDAYAKMTLGSKHPWALGRSAREVWAEIWGDIGPRAEKVIATGEATWDEGLLLFLERRGFPEETYHTFSYSPIPGDQSGIGGMLCVVTEDTERTIGERRLRTLRELAARTMEEARSPEDACQTAVRALAHDPHDLPFALIYLLDEDNDIARLAGSTGLPMDAAFAPSSVDLAATVIEGGWPLATVLRTGRTEVVPDLARRFGQLPRGVWPEPPQAAVVVPMAKIGQGRPTGFAIAGLSPRLEFVDAYRGFIELLAGHVATAVGNARAYQEERRRAEALAELDRAKTRFFSNISHEFRTPLTLMLGPVEELLASHRDELLPAAADQLEIVNRNGVRLLRLVNTLLDFSRIEAGRVRAAYQPTDLAAFTAELASVFRAAVERAGVRLEVGCSALEEPVFVDREMWEKIVLNLLSNAFKFTFEGEIAVSLKRVGEFAELRVRDTGTGIPAEEMPRLFERFHRVENARGRTHEGSGIGLALVQELVRLHGGEVEAQSALGVGTTFSVLIPFGSAHLPADQVMPAVAADVVGTGAAAYVEEAQRWLPDAGDDRAEFAADRGRLSAAHRPAPRQDADERPLVLVADDNADMRQYVVRLLADQFRTRAAPDGAAALAAAKQLRPDLVLTDVMMPKLDGFGLLRELRADPLTSSIPVIMLSARAGEESRVEGMQAGADDYLVKPFTARELLARVGAHLEMARLRREATQSLRQSEERLRMALTAGRMVAWQWDVATGELQVSENATEVFGLPSGMRLKSADQGFALVHPDDLERHRATVMSALAERRSYLSQFRMIRPNDAAIIWLEERGHAVAAGPDDAVRLVGVVMDISERKSAEAHAREAEARFRQVLVDADRRKDEFLAMLAHELRGPLAPLRNGLQIISKSDERATRMAAHDMMNRQLRQMTRLIDDLLDVSRVSRGKLDLRKERVELARVVQSAVETCRPLVEERGHALAVDLPAESVVLEADFTRLAQAFSNLLNNAAKFTEHGGHIQLLAEQHDGEIVVRIRDDGVGIPPAMLPQVFDLFTQVDLSLERSQGGLGIGLTVVKRLVDMHGGSVEARSDGHGRGSEFVVRLPLAPAPLVPLAAPEDNAAPPVIRRRILVADDNPDSADSLAMLLGILGNEVRTASDGLQAVATAEAFRPDVVLLDIGMPKLNGYAAARRIRAQPWGGRMVIVAVTGWGQQDDRRKSREAGCEGHIVKPVDLAVLENLLASLSPAREHHTDAARPRPECDDRK